MTDLETAKQMAALLEAENARLHQRLELLVQENARLKGEDAQARLQLELTQLAEQLALIQQRLFGASSEKRKPAVEATPPASARKQRGHGPRAQPQLPVQEVVLPLDEADKVCGLCGGALMEWAGQPGGERGGAPLRPQALPAAEVSLPLRVCARHRAGPAAPH
ncbi:hypothetical protein [Pyxidicoccus sp. MSG2]|uniref:hypothetical protein n=1 Tax=Pyxidicoccus sp. MSG2 TaxID=2996790 RepID=UPI002271D664|nr:hypothetical protein [Pyxidicoccus sp. MSG2]MCY1019264.1 hypothetical protein [Pyxidicoccus sp. MSG2]